MNIYTIVGLSAFVVFIAALITLFKSTTRENRNTSVVALVCSLIVAAIYLPLSDSVSDSERCEELKKNGAKVIQDGRCYIEISPGVYQNISGKRVRTYLESELRK